VGPLYSKMGPNRCIGGPQFVFQVPKMAHLEIYMVVDFPLRLLAYIFIINYLIRMYVFIFNITALCCVFSHWWLGAFGSRQLPALSRDIKTTHHQGPRTKDHTPGNLGCGE